VRSLLRKTLTHSQIYFTKYLDKELIIFRCFWYFNDH